MYSSVLIAAKGNTMVPKLGDFGTSFKLEEDGRPPSTHAGTKAYWAPEINEDDKGLSGRITKWSKESDIWGIGAVLYRILTGQRPIGKQSDCLQERITQLRGSMPEGRVAIPRLLAYVVSECLDPSVNDRPSALQVLAIAMKWDDSLQGRERSESFWGVMAMHTDHELVSSVVTHFVSKHLSLLERKPMFSLLETALIISLAYKHCPRLILQCHLALCDRLLIDEGGELSGSTAFHVIAWLPTKDTEIVRFAFEDSMWPFAKELSHLAIRKNKADLLPSGIAALRGKKSLHVRLAKIEEQVRGETHNNYSKSERDSVQSHATREFEFMFNLLTQNVKEFGISSSEASRAMIGIARAGFSNMVRKLVELGIDPSSPSIRGSRSETVLHIFASLGDASMVRFLLGKIDVDVRDIAGRTPLHWAAWAGQDEAVDALLLKKADINAIDGTNRTAIYGAAGGGFTDVVSRLLSYHADITIPGGKHDETALERARKNNHIAVVNLLTRNAHR
ncbi:hypothetical protein M426DRAFT_237927 [Hypoxylon sp. CI-4A]|nr:hypothetical protein M426DRAFT_237927 [Hypoxylon sp. CI-4A]